LSNKILDYNIAKTERRLKYLLAEMEIQQKIEYEILKEIKEIYTLLHEEGGPLHTNRPNYTRDQLFIFQEIDRLIEPLIHK